jgi:hypothetical protein
MAEKINISDLYGPDFPSTEHRLHQAYANPVVHDISLRVMRASTSIRPVWEAYLTTYLAAAHMLFPEESQIIHDSLRKD